MDRRSPNLSYDNENEEYPLDNEMSTISYMDITNSVKPLDEEEAQAYSSVYDMPFSSRQRKSPKR